MSLVRALRCAACAPRAACTISPSPRLLHSSASRSAKKDGKTGRKLAAAKPSSTSDAVKTYVKAYTPEERAKLEEKYTPEQLAALEAGEEAVDPEDLYEQGMLRDDSMGVHYIDDFSKIRPYIDNPVKPAKEIEDPNVAVMKSDDEFAQDLLKWADEIPEDGNASEWKRLFDDIQVTKGTRESEQGQINYVQPPLPKLTDPLMRRTVRAGKNEAGSEDQKRWQLLAKQTGMPITELRRLRLKQLVSHRVVNQTRLGKIGKNYVLFVAGDKNGLLGVGEASAAEFTDAVFKARRNAIRGMVPIPRYESRTIYGDCKGKVGATELELFTRPPGFGLRCQEKILEVCKCAGISDLAARVTRARNPMNTVKATVQALLKQRDPEMISRARGRKMVDVRKVYYAGLT